MNDKQRSGRDTMRKLAQFTKLDPTYRMDLCQKVIEKINDTDTAIKIEDRTKTNSKEKCRNVRLNGYCLPKPPI